MEHEASVKVSQAAVNSGNRHDILNEVFKQSTLMHDLNDESPNEQVHAGDNVQLMNFKREGPAQNAKHPVFQHDLPKALLKPKHDFDYSKVLKKKKDEHYTESLFSPASIRKARKFKDDDGNQRMASAVPSINDSEVETEDRLALPVISAPVMNSGTLSPVTVRKHRRRKPRPVAVDQHALDASSANDMSKAVNEGRDVVTPAPDDDNSSFVVSDDVGSDRAGEGDMEDDEEMESVPSVPRVTFSRPSTANMILMTSEIRDENGARLSRTSLELDQHRRKLHCSEVADILAKIELGFRIPRVKRSSRARSSRKQSGIHHRDNVPAETTRSSTNEIDSVVPHRQSLPSLGRPSTHSLGDLRAIIPPLFQSYRPKAPPVVKPHRTFKPTIFMDRGVTQDSFRTAPPSAAASATGPSRFELEVLKKRFGKRAIASKIKELDAEFIKFG